MIKFKNLLKLLTSMVTGLTIGMCTSYTHYSNSYRPYKWSSSPIIANCYGEDISESKIQSAVDFWQDYGNEVAFILMDPPGSVCNHDFLDGFIIIKKAPRGKLAASTLARTETKISMLRIKAAVIYFKPGTYNLAWLTQHELGHALGYKHVEEPGNVMHPIVEFQGGKYWIPD